ncbi:hypothetical protein WS67_05840 [Burkholderia singularis]|uniref:Uncharacterized protein n=1 Tax=Burkholderia singularis TaxID=1503053 RepID=A0A103E6P2_9BURK|nr:DUF1488 domain-containing protein [Burkholderia singularis]KVE29370.1 hypothetical protein WS67_05840 [Burkholderia singularis]
MPAESVARVRLMGEPPEFDGAALLLRFWADVDGRRVPCAITAEALEDHFGARGALEDDLRAAFERGRERIRAACADVLARDNGGVVLHSGYFRSRDRAVAALAKARAVEPRRR